MFENQGFTHGGVYQLNKATSLGCEITPSPVVEGKCNIIACECDQFVPKTASRYICECWHSGFNHRVIEPSVTALDGGHYKTATEMTHDPINPSHYGGTDNVYEHVKCMEAIGLDKDAFLYQCTKYIWRAGKKHPDILQDLKKAAWFLNRRIKNLEQEQEKVKGEILKVFPLKGYAFIKGEDGMSRFMHASDIIHGKFAELKEKAQVEFLSLQGEKGLRAKEVKIL